MVLAYDILVVLDDGARFIVRADSDTDGLPGALLHVIWPRYKVGAVWPPETTHLPNGHPTIPGV